VATPLKLARNGQRRPQVAAAMPGDEGDP